MRTFTKVLAVMACATALAASPTVANAHGRGFHPHPVYHHAPYRNYGHGHGHWLAYGLGAAIIGSAIIDSEQPYSYAPPVAPVVPPAYGGYHYVQVPAWCYPQNPYVQPYVCGYQNELVPNE